MSTLYEYYISIPVSTIVKSQPHAISSTGGWKGHSVGASRKRSEDDCADGSRLWGWVAVPSEGDDIGGKPHCPLSLAPHTNISDGPSGEDEIIISSNKGDPPRPSASMHLDQLATHILQCWPKSGPWYYSKF